MNVVDELEKIEKLKSGGYLTQAEFDRLKHQLLTGTFTRAPDIKPQVSYVAAPVHSPNPSTVAIIVVVSLLATILILSVAAYWYLNKPRDATTEPATDQEIAADDIMASRYGNTTVSIDAIGQRSEFYYFPDQTFRANTPEGSFNGTWQVYGTRICFTYETPPAATPTPLCVPVSPHKVGDTWTTGKGDNQTTTTIVEGILD